MLEKKLPWGKLWIVGQTPTFDIVHEVIEPGKAVPLAYYKTRTAIIYILEGRGKCLGKDIKKGDLLKFGPKEKHELINTSNKNLEFIYICIPPHDNKDFVECE
jgi:mannose-6-phosphate isomerase-like protein (cupin superfamily)